MHRLERGRGEQPWENELSIVKQTSRQDTYRNWEREPGTGFEEMFQKTHGIRIGREARGARWQSRG